MAVLSRGRDTPPAAVPRPRRRRWRRVLLLLLVALALVAAGVLVALDRVQARLADNVEHVGEVFAALPTRPPVPPEAAVPDPETGQLPLNLLVLGSDSRISAGDPSQWQAGAQRTDVIMLVHLPAEGGAAQVMSFPRDSWVEVPGQGSAKINAAFSLGGPALLVHTVEQLTGVRIDHFAVADFASFQGLTERLGGVRITLREPLYDGDRLVLPAGPQLLDGEQALTYVRQRKGLERGDLDRVQRQQAWIRAILARVRNEEVLQNPVRSVPFLDAVTSSVSADDGLTEDVLKDLVDRVQELGSTDVDFFTVPTSGTGRSPDGVQSIVVLDRPALRGLMEAVARDDVDAYVEREGDQLDVLPPVAP